MTTREENWAALGERVQGELEGFARVMVTTWKYPEGELIVVGRGVDLIGALLGPVVGAAQVEVRVRLDETGRIPGSPR